MLQLNLNSGAVYGVRGVAHIIPTQKRPRGSQLYRTNTPSLQIIMNGILHVYFRRASSDPANLGSVSVQPADMHARVQQGCELALLAGRFEEDRDAAT
jgi:hypothetical protein